MVNIPLPFDPRPSKAHPDHRAARLQLEKEHPAFNNKDTYIKAGLLALMGAIALFPWEKKHQEHDDRIRKEEREKGRRGSGDQDSRRRRPKSLDGRRRDGGREGYDRRKSLGDGYGRGFEGDYDYREGRRGSRDRGSERGKRVKRDADGQRRSKDGGRHMDDLKHELF